MQLTLHKKSFKELTKDELMEILVFRSSIFLTELSILFQDPDEYDYTSTHIYLTDESDEIVGYVRCIPQLNDGKDNSSFGKLCIKKQYRKSITNLEVSYGLLLANEAIKTCREISPSFGVVIHTLEVLSTWYKKIGFSTVGDAHQLFGKDFIWMSINPRAYRYEDLSNEPKKHKEFQGVKVLRPDLTIN